jgi:hypothetical protein
MKAIAALQATHLNNSDIDKYDSTPSQSVLLPWLKVIQQAVS